MPKKFPPKRDDDLRAEYKRSDFDVMERGKYVRLARLALERELLPNTDVATTPESLHVNADS